MSTSEYTWSSTLPLMYFDVTSYEAGEVCLDDSMVLLNKGVSSFAFSR